MLIRRGGGVVYATEAVGPGRGGVLQVSHRGGVAPPDAMDRVEAPAMPATIELSARSIAADPDALKLIPEATRVYLVDGGDEPASEWAQACRRLVRAGLEPVPHIACRRIRSLEEIDKRLKAMAEAGRVRDALVVGGDIARPAGPFASSMDLLATGILERHGIRRIGIAGHPEGSPDVAPAAMVDALHRKIEFGVRNGLEVRLVTQFGFDPEVTIRWTERLAEEGVRLPIHVGVAGPTGMARLLKYAALCGVRATASFALKRGAALTSLMGGYSPEPYARAIEKISRIVQLHIYAFGGLPATARWLIGRGSWRERDETTQMIQNVRSKP